MSLIELQRAIEALPADQQAHLAAWLAERDRRHWDLEIEQDFSPGGEGTSLLEDVRARVAKGESTPMAERRERR